jgi:hypothetical protein
VCSTAYSDDLITPRNRPPGVMLVLFGAAVLAGAFLLFLIQPIIARLVLPLLGGSPAVWTTCMLFFQAALLAGYAYVHWTTRLLSLGRQMALHAVVVVVPLTVLPVSAPHDTADIERSPVAWLLLTLIGGIGLPFFALAATAPLLQRWFSETTHPAARDPYFLYAASNAGSLMALLAYPLAVEPLMSLRVQRMVWSGGYIALAALVLLCAVVTSRSLRTAAPIIGGDDPRTVAIGRRLRWLLLSFVPSGLLLAVTAHISTDIAAFPLLWVVPLALYLSTFIIAFSTVATTLVPVARRVMPLVVLPVVLMMLAQGTASLWFVLPLHLLAFTSLALLCHTELARLRPPAKGLTAFYMWLALGGVLGGAFNSVIAPNLFAGVAEYPILLGAAPFVLASTPDLGLLVRQPWTLAKPLATGVLALALLAAGEALDLTPAELLPVLGLPVLLAFTMSRQPGRLGVAIASLLLAGALMGPQGWGNVVYQDRTFFGVYRISVDPDSQMISLYHGTTLHGRQVVADMRPEPLTYYHRGSPIAEILDGRAPHTGSIGVVGLGVGSLAAYARPSERWTFYEIDPAVADIARDTRYFRFIEACGTDCGVLIGDGRLALGRATGGFDLLVLDAFSSDAIPVHLLTREAMHVYLSRLSENGVLAFHISNRHFDLRPALGRLAEDLNLFAIGRVGELTAHHAAGATVSSWVALSRSPDRLATFVQFSGWTRLTPAPGRPWTDDFANVWSAIEWR